MQVLKAELESEKRQVAKIKACSGEVIKLEEELRFCREHNAEIAERVQETGMILDK